MHTYDSCNTNHNLYDYHLQKQKLKQTSIQTNTWSEISYTCIKLYKCILISII